MSEQDTNATVETTQVEDTQLANELLNEAEVAEGEALLAAQGVTGAIEPTEESDTDAPDAPVVPEGYKYCKGCVARGLSVEEATKSLDQFSVIKSTGKPSPQCKKCRSIQSTAWAKRRENFRKVYQTARKINAAGGEAILPDAKTWQPGEELVILKPAPVKERKVRAARGEGQSARASRPKRVTYTPQTDAERELVASEVERHRNLMTEMLALHRIENPLPEPTEAPAASTETEAVTETAPEVETAQVEEVAEVAQAATVGHGDAPDEVVQELTVEAIEDESEQDEPQGVLARLRARLNS
jgi:hypothetical protein